MNLDRYEVSFEELERFRTVPKHTRLGKYWKGLPHHLFFHIVNNALESKRWKVRGTKIYLSPDRWDMMIVFDLSLPKLRGLFPTVRLMFATSNTGHFSLKSYAGLPFTVSVNLVMKEIFPKRKHTFRFDLAHDIYHILIEFEAFVQKMARQVYIMKNQTLDANKWSFLIENVARKNLLPWSRIGQWKAAVNRINRTRTVWDVFTQFCLISQKSPIFKNPYSLGQLEQMNQFRKILKNF